MKACAVSVFSYVPSYDEHHGLQQLVILLGIFWYGLQTLRAGRRFELLFAGLVLVLSATAFLPRCFSAHKPVCLLLTHLEDHQTLMTMPKF